MHTHIALPTHYAGLKNEISLESDSYITGFFYACFHTVKSDTVGPISLLLFWSSRVCTSVVHTVTIAS